MLVHMWLLWLLLISLLFSVRVDSKDFSFPNFTSSLCPIQRKTILSVKASSPFSLFCIRILLGLWSPLICKQVMPAVVNVMKEEATLVTLVKPQFEARRSQVRKPQFVLYMQSFV